MFEKNLISLETKPVPSYDILSVKNEAVLLSNVLAYFNKAALLKTAPVEEKTYVTNWIFDEQGVEQSVEQINHLIKYNDQFTVSFLKTVVNNDKVTYNFKGIALNNEDAIKKIALFKNDELQVENEVESDVEILQLPEYKEPVEDKDNTLTAMDWDDCWKNGCCSFRYNGLPWNPLVNYNWCGKGCGSGTPVNGLDKCCEIHDKCYVGKTYPAKCKCDEAAAICAGKTDFAGSDRVYGAMITLLSLNGC
ncbi:hypothetical protein [Solibacillus sp. NPDC093137]|uniref:hypothetical protein n=1 Tax=Solibacillus sp. NPDC093137 TaxID=3390678 RepID=UPI003CFF12B3